LTLRSAGRDLRSRVEQYGYRVCSRNAYRAACAVAGNTHARWRARSVECTHTNNRWRRWRVPATAHHPNWDTLRICCYKSVGFE